MPQKQDNTKQIDKFRQAARELETDDSEEAFDAKLRKIAQRRDRQSDVDDELVGKTADALKRSKALLDRTKPK